MTQEQMNEPAPITRNQIDYFPALLTTVSAEELGENESVISPKIKANKGIDTPLAMAAISPIVNNNLSLEVAYLNNAKNETFGSGSLGFLSFELGLPSDDYLFLVTSSTNY